MTTTVNAATHPSGGLDGLKSKKNLQSAEWRQGGSYGTGGNYYICQVFKSVLMRKQKQLSVLLACGLLTLPAMGDTIRLTTAAPVGTTVEIALNSAAAAKVVWADESETPLDPSGGLTRLEIKSAEFSLTSDGPLTTLFLPSASLTAIDLADAPNLTALNCPNNSLTELDLADADALTTLDVQGNALESLSLSGAVPALTSLNCAYNRLTSLTVGSKPDLTTLICAGNPLQQLSLGSCRALRTVWCQDCDLTRITLPGGGSLHTLYAFNNALTSLSLNAPQLSRLMADYNSLATLDLSAAEQLAEVDADHNALSRIMLAPAATATLTRYYVQNNNLGFNSFPTVSSSLTAYALAPQSAYDMATGDAKVGEEYAVGTHFEENAQGRRVSYDLSWINASTGQPLERNTDYSNRVKGTYTFLKAFPDSVYAEVTAGSYPDVTVRTLPVRVTDGTDVGISATDADAPQIRTADGMLYVTLPARQRVRIVTTGGAVMADKILPAGTHSFALEHGVYLVGRTKVLIP